MERGKWSAEFEVFEISEFDDRASSTLNTRVRGVTSSGVAHADSESKLW
jgi:hypothetical protein